MPTISALTPPNALPSLAQGGDTVYVVIETPRGSRNKISFDEDLGAFRLKKVLPQGMSFPYDFGFIPSTLGSDGDPVDALVIMDEPASPGCVTECRLIGAILGEEGPEKRATRNDRLVAVAVPSLVHGSLRSLDDLDKARLKELEQFFVNYNRVHGKEYRLLGCKGPQRAWKLLQEGMRAWTRAQGKEGPRESVRS